MLIPHAEFPVRPVRARGESLVGYIHRFYFENVHDIPLTLRQALRDYYTGQNSDYAFQMVTKAVCPDRQRDSRLFDNQRIDVKLSGGRRYFSKRLHYNPIRYCPACLSELGFHAELWTLPQVEACAYHRCQLLTRCSTCDRSLTWGTLRAGWLCRCGMPLTEGDAAVVSKWKIDLAVIMIQAADMEKPYPDNGHLEPATLSDYDQYIIHDVYQFLARIEYLRRDLGRGHIYDSRYRWPFNIKPSVQSDSERWSLRFLTADRKTRTIHLLRLLRWNFRQHKTVLVRGSSQSPLALVLNALVHLQKNPFANAYLSQANALLLEYQVGIESLVGVYFHPRLPISYHQQYLAVLARWWHGLANRLVILEPEYQFEKTYRLSTGGGSLDQVIDVLNTLFDAALSRRSFECYGKFAKRWSIPEAMRRRLQASEILAVMVAYLSGLQSSEISFFHCLLEDATYVSVF